MLPQLHIGPLTLQTFGICFALGFVAAGLTIARRLRELGKPVDWAYEIVFAAAIGGLIGARLDYIAQDWDRASKDLLGNLFSGSGLVWFGGLIGGAIGVLIWARLRGFFNARVLDVCAPALAIGYAIGRVGCQVSGDGDYGTHTGAPWGMAFPDGTKPTTDTVQPTPVFETLAMGVLALALWHLRDRFRPGVLFGIYLIGAGVERLLIEFIRRNESIFLGLTQPQLISIGMVVLGGAMAAALVRRGGGSAIRPSA